MILADVDYTFESDGVTPQDDVWAHRIVGVFSGQGVVCEGYAKTLQLLLNVSHVENLYIPGDAGGGHAWSLIRLDDGEWYWYDSTWNDAGHYQSTWLPGRAYFAILDSTIVDEENNTAFSESHIPKTDSTWGWPTLPDRADTNFDGENIIEVLSTFTVGKNTYQVVGYNSVHLIASSETGVYTVPEYVFYNGIFYDVVGTGTVEIHGYTNFDSVFANQSLTHLIFGSNVSRIQGITYCYSLKEVTISKSVKIIDRYAFVNCYNLKTINFEGTIAEWNAIQKDSTWNYYCETITVKCSDGTITV